MRIVILVRILWTGGAQKIAIQEARELLKLGHEVELCFLRGSPLRGYDDLLSSLNVVTLSTGKPSMTSGLWNLLTQRFARDRGAESRVDFDQLMGFPFRIRPRPPDLLICHDQYAALAGYYCDRLLRIPYVVYVHESLPDYDVPILGVLATRHIGQALRHAVAVNSVTLRVAASVRGKYGLDAIVNPPGMDEIASPGHSSRDNTILAVSMWDLGRRPTVYLSLLDRLPQYRLVMAGNWRIPRLKESFLNEVDRRGLRQRVQILEGLRESDLLGLYYQAKFSVRFGFGEHGPGMSVIESIQTGTPVVVNSELGSSEIVAECGGGLVVNDVDAQRISEFVHEHDDPEHYSTLQKGLRSASQKYTWKAHIGRLLPGSLLEFPDNAATW